MKTSQISQWCSSFSHIEEKIREYANSYDDYPLQAMLMHRMQIHINNKLLEARNHILQDHKINDTLFMALIVIDSQKDRTIQPSELSSILGTSRTNATRIADELVNNGWVIRNTDTHDRRCIYLRLTDEGGSFIKEIRPKQFANLRHVWSALTKEEQQLYEILSRKILHQVNKLEI